MCNLGHWAFTAVQPCAWWPVLVLTWCVLPKMRDDGEQHIPCTGAADAGWLKQLVLRTPAGRKQLVPTRAHRVLHTRLAGQSLVPLQPGVLLAQALISTRAVVHSLGRSTLQQGRYALSLRLLATVVALRFSNVTLDSLFAGAAADGVLRPRAGSHTSPFAWTSVRRLEFPFFQLSVVFLTFPLHFSLLFRFVPLFSVS